MIWKLPWGIHDSSENFGFDNFDVGITRRTQQLDTYVHVGFSMAWQGNNLLSGWNCEVQPTNQYIFLNFRLICFLFIQIGFSENFYYR